MALVAPGPPAKFRWGELDEDDDGNSLDFLLPPKQTIGPDENGIKTVIEYKFNEDGQKVKITSTIRTKKLAEARLSKRAVERRSWPKFGDAAGHDDAGDHLTVVSTEEITIERPGAADAKPEEQKKPAEPAYLMQCRTCGRKGEHWTAQCPYKDLAPKPGIDGGAAVGETSRPGKYVPPGGRNPGSRPPRNEETSVRVGNLSEDTREADLRELFGAFGPLSRVFVSVGKGFGFVNFVNKEDGQRAINRLNGYGYDSLILEVEWAKPRTN